MPHSFIHLHHSFVWLLSGEQCASLEPLLARKLRIFGKPTLWLGFGSRVWSLSLEDHCIGIVTDYWIYTEEVAGFSSPWGFPRINIVSLISVVYALGLMLHCVFAYVNEWHWIKFLTTASKYHVNEANLSIISTGYGPTHASGLRKRLGFADSRVWSFAG